MKSSIHGSTWWKCDFHNHTPKSDDYGNAQVRKEDMTPREWVLTYMRAGIDCIGVTDHNTGEYIDVLKEEVEKLANEQPLDADFRPIHIFPGVEISVVGGIHLLAIFDPSMRWSS